MANNNQQAEKKLRKWFDNKVEVMTFGNDKSLSNKLKKHLQDKFINNAKGE